MCGPRLVDLSIACAEGACLGKGVGWVEGLLTKYQINTHHDISQNSEVGSRLSRGRGDEIPSQRSLNSRILLDFTARGAIKIWRISALELLEVGQCKLFNKFSFFHTMGWHAYIQTIDQNMWKYKKIEVLAFVSWWWWEMPSLPFWAPSWEVGCSGSDDINIEFAVLSTSSHVL